LADMTYWLSAKTIRRITINRAIHARIHMIADTCLQRPLHCSWVCWVSNVSTCKTVTCPGPCSGSGWYETGEGGIYNSPTEARHIGHTVFRLYFS
jgi:hypothetical protein